MRVLYSAPVYARTVSQLQARGLDRFLPLRLALDFRHTYTFFGMLTRSSCPGTQALNPPTTLVPRHPPTVCRDCDARVLRLLRGGNSCAFRLLRGRECVVYRGPWHRYRNTAISIRRMATWPNRRPMRNFRQPIKLLRFDDQPFKLQARFSITTPCPANADFLTCSPPHVVLSHPGSRDHGAAIPIELSGVRSAFRPGTKLLGPAS